MSLFLRRLRLLSILGLVLLFAPASAAQSPPSRLLPYAFVAPGTASGSATLHLGGGVETPVGANTGGSVEIGYIGPLPGFDDGVGVVSANLIVHLQTPGRRRFTPYVTGGYSLAFRWSMAHLLNAGVGVHYCVRDNLAVRVELRDHVFPARLLHAPHLLGVRVGATWRP